MSTHQHATLEDTVYMWFGANATSGSGDDGASPVYDVRLAGAAAGAAPVLSGNATLLSHANYSAGAHEVAVAATDGNGFAAGNTYAVFVTLLVDSQNPTGFAGSFTLGPIISDMTHIHGTALTETATQLAGAFTKFFDVAAPTATALSLPDAVPGAAGGAFIAGTNAATTITTALTTTFTGDLTGNVDGTVAGKTPAEAGDLMGLADEAITAAKYDESTAFPLTAVNGSTLTEAGGTGDHLTAINLPNQTMDIVGDITGNLSGSVGSVAANGITATSMAADSINAASIKDAAIDFATFAADVKTGAGLKANVESISANAITATAINADAITADAFAADAIVAATLATDAISADALAADAVTEIWAKAMSDLAGIPAADASVLDAINIMFMALRNKQTGTSSAQTISNDAGATIATAVLTDAAGTTTKGEYA